MSVNREKLFSSLASTETVALATSVNDAVEARPVSVLAYGDKIIVRTSAASRKARSMSANPNTAVCVGAFYFTAKARPLGSAYSAENAPVREEYKKRFPGAFAAEDEFIASDEQFFELTPALVSEWVYENGFPVRLETERF